MNRTLVFVCCFVIAAGFIACERKEAVISAWKSDKIELDSSTEKYADTAYLAYLSPIRGQLEQAMAETIGYAPEPLKSYRPESPLSKLLADVYRSTASAYLQQPIDLAIVNFGGIRSDLPAGNITIRTIFEILPFENELVIVWLKGDKISELLAAFANIGGEGVSGLRMKIVNQKAVNILINGEPLDPDKVYTIATNDYLADGNDGMPQLAHFSKIEKTGMKIRDIFIQYIKQQTAAGKPITASSDARITVQNK